jgi:hypothetical protein
VTAVLYKLLLYEEGGFFKTHRDTEKADGMFATLVLQLPSTFTGGEFVVTHGGVSRTFDLALDGDAAPPPPPPCLIVCAAHCRPHIRARVSPT